jgi:predicted TPR repeat methyltransferase
VAVDGDNLEVWWVRAQALQRLGQTAEAMAEFEELLRIDPSLHFACIQKAGLLKDLGRPTEALAAFKNTLALGGDAELCGYFIALLTGQQAPSAPPRAFTKHLLDEYSDDSDRHLVQVLGYRAHHFLAEHLKGIGKPRFRAAPHLGCGTSLCGPLLRSRSDPSAKMLAKARELGVYDTLGQADLAEYLQATDQRYDLLFSCDVFIYIGALEKVFQGAARVLESGGVFCFSVEGAGDAQDFQLLPSQRYAHSERYLRTLAASHELIMVKTLSQPIRQD